MNVYIYDRRETGIFGGYFSKRVSKQANFAFGVLRAGRQVGLLSRCFRLRGMEKAFSIEGISSASLVAGFLDCQCQLLYLLS
jgi:hypothetical protein